MLGCRDMFLFSQFLEFATSHLESKSLTATPRVPVLGYRERLRDLVSKCEVACLVSTRLRWWTLLNSSKQHKTVVQRSSQFSASNFIDWWCLSNWKCWQNHRQFAKYFKKEQLCTWIYQIINYQLLRKINLTDQPNRVHSRADQN